MSTTTTRVCGTCALAGGDKYRCATCKTFKYCSVACFQAHQLNSPQCSKDKKSVPPSSSAASDPTAPPSASSAVPPSSSTSLTPTTTPATSTPAIPKSERETVSEEDFISLASDPTMINALASTELQSILRTIDSATSDQERIAALEKYRRMNSDFEAFIQQTLTIINREQ